MAMMTEKGIRGGVSMITTRHSEANNKYMGNQYDPKKQSKYIQYLYANNLCGWAMSQPLPTGGFRWMTSKQLDSWIDHPCILEVDLDYPQELHDRMHVTTTVSLKQGETRTSSGPIPHPLKDLS